MLITETTPTSTRYYSGEKMGSDTIKLSEARSSIMRDLEDSLPVRNSRLEVPEYVPSDIDELTLFVENRRIESLQHSVREYVRPKLLMYSLGQVALEDDRTVQLEVLPLSGRLDTATSLHVATWFSLEHFNDVENPIIYGLRDMDMAGAANSDSKVQQRALVLRAVLSALESVEKDSIPLSRTQGAKALRYG